MKISPETWKQVDPLLDDALDRQGEDRDRWIAALREREPGLAALVEELVQAHESAERSGALEIVSPITTPAEAPSLYRTDLTIGPFTLLRPLGRGGMGEVWLAEQTDGRVRRQVALKLPEMLGAGSLRAERFVRERDILARLEHPHIARLYDAGVAPGGQPWLAMEFVAGEPLDAYLAKRSLPVPQRLALFRQVLDAVAHAHRHLVVHRDLKPANILVDAEGRVKLLDFGIAKLVTEEAGAAREGGDDLTRVGSRLMTLRYAAPEQVEGGEITTATDVYSLGVVLHEVLAGVSPYRAVRERSPLTAAGLAREPIARPSQVATGPAARALAGDLDAIVLKALRSDPAERYASVGELDDDLRNHLECRPVRARAGTWRYLANRFARRHRLPIAMGAALVAVLAVGLAVAERERRAAFAQKERAERHLASVRQLANALIFDVHDQIGDLPGATRAKQVLVEKAGAYLARIAPEADDDPVFRRELAHTHLRLANIQGQYSAPNVGKWAEALASYDRAISLAAPAAQAGDAASGEIVARAWRNKGQALLAADRRTEAIDAFARGVDVARALAKAPGATPEQQLDLAVLIVDHSRAVAFRDGRQAQFDGLQQGIAIARQVLDSLPEGSVSPSRTRARLDLAWMSSYLGHWYRASNEPEDKRQAVAHFRTALAVREEVLGQSPLDATNRRGIVAHQTYIGLTLAELGETKEAPAFVTKAAEGIEALAQADPGNTQYRRDAFYIRVQLARVLLDAGRHEDALEATGRASAHAAALPEAIRRTASNLWTAADLHQWEGEARLGLARSLPPASGAKLVARARADFEAAVRLFDEADALKESTFRGDSGPRREKMARLLAQAGAAR